MALVEQVGDSPALRLGSDWIPEDTFAVRLGMIRVMLGGWNMKRAAIFCGIDPGSWSNWEKKNHVPQDYEAVCRKIADHTGCGLAWLKAGGPLIIRCFSESAQVRGLPAMLGSMRLFDPDADVPPPFVPVLVGIDA